MSIRAEVVTQLVRYDDDAWIALANRGLLRRATKDLASATPEVVAEGETVDVAIAGRLVRFPASGPAHATCDCPSARICQHIIAAGMWLARQHAASSEDTDTAEQDTESLHTQLLGLDRGTLVSLAGKAGYRWAWQYVADLDLVRDVEIETESHIRITLRPTIVTFRYMGGGPDSLVADQPLKPLERYQVAAVLAYQRAHGISHEPPETSAAAARGGDPVRDEQRAELRATVTRLLTDAVRVGLAHLSPGIHERFSTLAVGAQGADYHRLARLLRLVAEQVELSLQRAVGGDERRLLDSLALTYGLVSALEAAAAKGAAPIRLVGQARARYESLRTLDLVGLGGFPWRSRTGFQGLTTVFWDVAGKSFLTWTDARPVTVFDFSPKRRWNEAGPWQGLACPAATVGRRVTLTRPQVSVDGRISGVDSTTAFASELNHAELLGMLPIQESWSVVKQARDPRRQSLLDPPGSHESWAVLRPARYGTPMFDEVSQVLLWPLEDADGDVLMCVVPYSEANAPLVARIEALRPAPDTVLVTRLYVDRGILTAAPVSLIAPRDAQRAVDCLYFDQPPDGSAATPLRATPHRESAAEEPWDVLPRGLVELRAFLERYAERGVHGAAAEEFRAELARHHQRCADVGLTVFVPPDAETDPAALLLRSHYLVQQVSLALVGAPSSEAA